MSILSKIGLARASQLRAAEKEIERLNLEYQKQVRGNQVLWLAIKRSRRLNDAPAPDNLRGLLTK